MSTTLELPRSDAQHMKALRRANHVRYTRAHVKRQRHAGEVTFREAIDLPEVQTMLVIDLLMAGKGWGKARACKALIAAGVSQQRLRTIEDLTDRQRRVLCEIADFRLRETR